MDSRYRTINIFFILISPSCQVQARLKLRMIRECLLNPDNSVYRAEQEGRPQSCMTGDYCNQMTIRGWSLDGKQLWVGPVCRSIRLSVQV